MSAPSTDKVVYPYRSPRKGAAYHIGRGLENFGTQARHFRTEALATGAVLGVASAGLFFVAAPFAIPVAVMALGVVAGVPAGMAAGSGGARLRAWAYSHRTALHESSAEGWRKTGVALATAIACVPGVYAGYQVYKDSPAPDAREATLPSHSLKTAFDQGLTEKTVSQPVAAASSASKLVIR